MKAASKKFFFVLLSTLLISMLVPVSASADNPNSTLGTETPYMYCAFLDANGKQVDGNVLASGDYTVDIIVSDMANASILQFTAEYDSDVITSHSVLRTIADDAGSDVSLGGIKDENNILVVALASEDDNSTALDADCGTSIATMQVTIDAGEEETVDFEDVFSFSNDPDLTFLEADYADGYDDAYVTDVNAETAYNTYLMIADSSPRFYIVSGKVNIAMELDGSFIGEGTGIDGITATLEGDRVTVTAVTDEDGIYTLSSVPEGTYEVSFSGPTTIDRTLTLEVTPERADESGIINANPFGICVCDWNGDGHVLAGDKNFFNRGLNARKGDEAYKPYYDLNSDGVILAGDKNFFNRFNNQPLSSFYTQEVNL